MLRLFFYLILLSSPTLADTLSSSIDRSETSVNGFLEYSVTYDGDKTLNINDVAIGLVKDFTIIGQRRSQEVVFKNASRNISTKITFTLQPKKMGIFNIPSFNFAGMSTAPLSLKVGKAEAPKNTQSLGNAKPVFVEVALDNPTPMVNSQTIMSIKIYDTLGISRGVLVMPKLPDMISKPFEAKNNYTENKGGVNYRVQEQKVALFPLKSGDYQIAPITLKAEVPLQQRPSFTADPADPFADISNSILGSLQLLGTGRKVSIASNTTKLTTSPSPEIAKNMPSWFTAKEVKIKDNLVEKTTFKLGESITRKIDIDVVGNYAAAIPDIKPSEIENVKQYAADGEKNESFDGANMVATKTQTFILLPQKAQNITLPEINLSWFSTLSGKVEVATLPARQILVGSTQKINDDGSPRLTSTSTSRLPRLVWIIVAIFISLVSALFIQIYIIKKEPKSGAQDALDPQNLAKEIVKVFNKSFPENTVFSILEVANFLDNPEFSQEMQKINRIIYAESEETYDTQAILENLKSLIATKKHTSTSNPLPGLYDHE
jgi:hypothetical protein